MKRFNPVTEVRVGLEFGDGPLPVGRLARRTQTTYFEFDETFLERGLELSPLRMPVRPGVVSSYGGPFEGLPGVFNDSLPDGWGRLLFDRLVRSHELMPSEVSPLDRLAHVGKHGMGGLVYEPDYSAQNPAVPLSLDALADTTQAFRDGSSDEVLEELLALNGSSAGACPKALIGVDKARRTIIHGAHELPEKYEPWIVKFANTQDARDAGAIEYVYAIMAREAGISVPDVHLFRAQRGAGHFAIKRFNRDGRRRFHVHTVSGLLHADHRTPSLDYEDMLALAGILTRDQREVGKLYALAVFDVLAHNRDDHAKNFSFLMDDNGTWTLAPAYDLTFSSGPNGEQSTTVMGEGRTPGVAELKKLGSAAKLSPAKISLVIDRTQTALARWPILASEHGVSASSRKLITKRIT